MSGKTTLKPGNVEVTDLGLMFNKTPKIYGFDAAYSIPLDDRILWLFGDTFIEQDKNEMISNSAIFTEFFDPDEGPLNTKVRVNLEGCPVPIIDCTPKEAKMKYRIWPLHGLQLDHKVYIYYAMVKVIPGEQFPYRSFAFNFEVVGTGLADYDPILDESNRLLKDGSYIWWDKNEGNFGGAIIEVGDYIYIFGAENVGSGKKSTKLSRVKKENIKDRSKYKYLKSFKPAWTSDIREAIKIVDNVPCEMSVSYNEHLNKYLVVHSLVSKNSIILKLSDNVWGPYESYCNIPIKRTLKKALRYAGKEHSEFAKENGRIIYVTYVESEIYWPHLLKIEFK